MAATADEVRMNLAALQQRDPYITGIIDTAKQVALYSFNSKDSEWEKTEIEGTLFVYQRSANPTHGFIVLNRLGMNNQIEPITKEVEFQAQTPFLLYRNGKSICGIWFYDKEECERISELVNSVASQLKRAGNNRSKGAEDGKMSSSQRRQVDIMQMLSKAQDEYDKSSKEPQPMIDNPGASATPVSSSDLLKPTPRVASPHLAGGDGASSSGTTQISVETLFKTALNSNLAGPPSPAGKQNRSQSLSCESPQMTGPEANSDMPPLLKRLMSVSTVEEIERQQRNEYQPKTDQSGSRVDQLDPLVGSSAGAYTDGSYSPDTQLKRTLNILPSSSKERLANFPSSPQIGPTTNPLAGAGGGRPVFGLFSSELPTSDAPPSQRRSPAVPSQPTPPSTQSLHQTAGGVSGSLSSQYHSAPNLPGIGVYGQVAPSSTLVTPQALSQLSSAVSITQTRPATVLISPMAFEQPVKKSSPPVSAGPVAAASQMFSYTGGGPVCTSSPDQSPPVAPPGPAHINPLTREQMQQALLYLIKNDPSFMSVLHEAYVKSLTESFSKR